MAEEPRRCPVCGIPLRPSQSGDETCAALSCRRLQRRRGSRPAPPQPEARDLLSERRGVIEQKIRDGEGELRAQHGAAIPERVLRAGLPANEHRVVPLSEERRAAFEENVSAALDRALEDPDRPLPETPESPADNAPLIRAACSACRGSCCKYGGDRAYLYPDHFRRYLRDHPGRSRDEILSEYRSRLPAQAYPDSCVYHGETGCALPRELRSNLCNTFLCGDLADLLELQSKQDAPLPVLAFCFRDGSADLVRTALLERDGNARPLSPD